MPRWEPDPNVRRGRSVVHNLHAHLVFTPKYRRGVFTDPILVRCEEVMRDVCRDFGATLTEFNGEHDHVHLLVQYPPTVALSTLVNSLKGVSARRLRLKGTVCRSTRGTATVLTSPHQACKRPNSHQVRQPANATRSANSGHWSRCSKMSAFVAGMAANQSDRDACGIWICQSPQPEQT